MRQIVVWERNGGQVTMQQFQALPPAQRQELLEFMESFGWYETVDVGDEVSCWCMPGWVVIIPERSWKNIA